VGVDLFTGNCVVLNVWSTACNKCQRIRLGGEV